MSISHIPTDVITSYLNQHHLYIKRRPKLHQAGQLACLHENYNYKLSSCALRELARGLTWRREENAYVDGAWEMICGNMMTVLSYGVN